MQVNICEAGCGSTSQDQTADIKKMTALITINGSESPNEQSIEVCAKCRRSMVDTIRKIFQPRPLVFAVSIASRPKIEPTEETK